MIDRIRQKWCRHLQRDQGCVGYCLRCGDFKHIAHGKRTCVLYIPPMANIDLKPGGLPPVGGLPAAER